MRAEAVPPRGRSRVCPSPAARPHGARLQGQTRVDNVHIVTALLKLELSNDFPVLQNTIIQYKAGDPEGVVILVALKAEVPELAFHFLGIGDRGVRRDERPIAPRVQRTQEQSQR